MLKRLLYRNKKVAIFIVNYNMPERSDALYERLEKYTRWPIDIYLIDNGSDIKEPAINTNVFIKENVQTCRGWLEGLNFVKANKKRYFAYMFLITSASLIDDRDIVTPMVKFLIKNKDAVGIHPSLTKDSTTNWKHLHNRNTNKPRRTWMIDNIASMYRSDWFDNIGWFDKRLIYAWGIDLETCYIARKNNKTIWVDDRLQIEKITNIGYKMNRMNMKATEREKLAAENMNKVLEKKYGPNYWEKMTKDYISNDLL